MIIILVVHTKYIHLGGEDIAVNNEVSLLKTFVEMKPSAKYKIDHRYQAFKKIKKFL